MNDAAAIKPIAASAVSRTYDPARDEIAQVPKGPRRDLSSEHGALTLARELDAWWHQRGYPQVKHTVERALARRPNSAKPDAEATMSLWVVRSNLVGGLPPKP